MKILHISYSDNKGGASRAAIRIHQSLLKKKINSHFQVCIKNKSPKKFKNVIHPNLLNNLINLSKSAIESLISNLFKNGKLSKNSISLFSSQRFKRINASQYDIIHLHWINGETISIEDIGKIKKPVVWTLQDMWPFTGSEHYTFKNFWVKKNKFIKKKFFFNFDISNYTFERKKKCWKNKIYIVGSSRWITKSAKESLLMNKNPSITINNTLDTNFWKPISKKKSKEYFKIPHKTRVIGFSSLGNNNHFLKGKDLLCSAINNIKYKQKKIAILSIGDSNNINGLNNNLEIFNNQRIENDSELKKFYNALDLIVVPSRMEAFGQVASEAISCGVPVVSFNVGGLKDIVVHKKNGYLAKSFDINDLTKGMEYILNLKKNDYKKMSKNSVKISKNKFSFNKIGNQYLKLYRKILKENNK